MVNYHLILSLYQTRIGPFLGSTMKEAIPLEKNLDTHTHIIIIMLLVISMEKLIREINPFFVLIVRQNSTFPIYVHHNRCTEGNCKRNRMKVNFHSPLVKFTLHQEPFFCNCSHKLREGRAIAPPPKKSIYYYKKR